MAYTQLYLENSSKSKKWFSVTSLPWKKGNWEVGNGSGYFLWN